jgi:DNA polymerase III epsilon subunit-like protein
MPFSVYVLEPLCRRAGVKTPLCHRAGALELICAVVLEHAARPRHGTYSLIAHLCHNAGVCVPPSSLLSPRTHLCRRAGI